MTSPAPGWYPNPSDPSSQIYFDGQRWVPEKAVTEVQRKSAPAAAAGSSDLSERASAPAPGSTEPISDEARARLLQEHLSQMVITNQSRVESSTPYAAVVVSGRPVNHVLHLLASVFLCGLWLPIWFVMAMAGGEKRHVVAVDQYGNVTRR